MLFCAMSLRSAQRHGKHQFAIEENVFFREFPTTFQALQARRAWETVFRQWLFMCTLYNGGNMESSAGWADLPLIHSAALQ